MKIFLKDLRTTEKLQLYSDTFQKHIMKHEVSSHMVNGIPLKSMSAVWHIIFLSYG
jgi:hypothetical protein